MAYISSDKGRIIVEAEDTPGEDAIDALLGTVGEDIVYQAIRARNIITPTRTEVNTGTVKGGVAGSPKATVPSQCDVSADVLFTGLQEDKDIPEWHDWMLASNMTADVEVGVGVTYTPSKFTEKTLSIYEFKDNLDDNKARIQKALNVVGSWNLQASLNEPLFFTWTGIGHYYKPGKAFEYYDAYNSLAKKVDGTTGFGSHDQFITIEEATESHAYKVLVDAEEFTHTAAALDDVEAIVDALIPLINAEATIDVTASKEGTDTIKLTRDGASARFMARIPRREDKMSIFSRERWSDDSDQIIADGMTITVGDHEVEASSVSINQNNTPQGINTITGSTGVDGIVNGKPLADNVTVTIELMDGDEDLYNDLMDRVEDDGFFTLDIEGSNHNTDYHIKASNMQINLPAMSEQGLFVGWTITGMLSGQWASDVSGGQDFSIAVTHKS